MKMSTGDWVEQFVANFKTGCLLGNFVFDDFTSEGFNKEQDAVCIFSYFCFAYLNWILCKYKYTCYIVTSIYEGTDSVSSYAKQLDNKKKCLVMNILISKEHRLWKHELGMPECHITVQDHTR